MKLPPYAINPIVFAFAEGLNQTSSLVKLSNAMPFIRFIIKDESLIKKRASWAKN